MKIMTSAAVTLAKLHQPFSWWIFQKKKKSTNKKKRLKKAYIISAVRKKQAGRAKNKTA